MKEKLKINVTKPQYVQVSDITYAQVDSWYDHCRRDLKLDLIYPEDMSDKRYPCIVWICGGGWMRMDKSAHLSYLSTLAHQGFVVCSVEYRTSNEGCYPMQIEDVKAAIRYLKAHADRYRIDKEHFGAMGESAGGFLTCMAALDHHKPHFAELNLTQLKRRQAHRKQPKQYPRIISDHTCKSKKQEKRQFGGTCQLVYHTFPWQIIQHCLSGHGFAPPCPPQ